MNKLIVNRIALCLLILNLFCGMGVPATDSTLRVDTDSILALSELKFLEKPIVIRSLREPSGATDSDESLVVIFKMSEVDADIGKNCNSPGYVKSSLSNPVLLEKYFGGFSTRQVCWRQTGEPETGLHLFVIVGDSLFYQRIII